ncbi:MAG: ATP-binding protein, partial [Cytophaga sp.]|uniref:sensor histidine kinase n=1 Tax=Cytophaga sp. TaxID=29535 RepID=UPI003F7D62A7
KEEFIKGIKEYKPDVILSDHSLPQFNSLEAHKICLSEQLYVPFILVTGAVSEEFAVACLKNGIDDYILKSNLSRLPTAILSALKQRELEKMKIEALRELKEQNEQILKINKELDSFIYSISHSLRGPLSTVSGLLNLAEIEGGANNKNVKELHQMMETCIKRLDTTLGQMVDQSKNARLDIDTEAIDINAIIDKSIKNVSYLPGSENTEVTVINTSKVSFYSDAYRLEVIFNSLLSNAIKYRDFTKEKAIVLIQYVCTPETVAISFKDNGLGIPEKFLPKVFNMFYRASERSDGAGLGLYIVKEFVEKLKGTVNISSVENESTTVTIILPNISKDYSSSDN